ncbi:hypothetical protein D3C85_1262110 [compost metagenome]
MKQRVDLHHRADNLVVIKNEGVHRAHRVTGEQEQHGDNAARQQHPEQVHQQVLNAEHQAGHHRGGQAHQAGPHRHALIEQHVEGEQAQARTAEQGGGPKVLAQ